MICEGESASSTVASIDSLMLLCAMIDEPFPEVTPIRGRSRYLVGGYSVLSDTIAGSSDDDYLIVFSPHLPFADILAGTYWVFSENPVRMRLDTTRPESFKNNPLP